MTSAHLKSVFEKYLAQWGAHYPPQRQDTTDLDPRNKEKVLLHTMWMCKQGTAFVDEGDVEKAMRWLGFVQGMLFYTGHYTIDEMRAHSASPTEP